MAHRQIPGTVVAAWARNLDSDYFPDSFVTFTPQPTFSERAIW